MYKSVCFANVCNMLYLFVCHNFVSISICIHDSIELACLFFGSLVIACMFVSLFVSCHMGMGKKDWCHPLKNLSQEARVQPP